MTYFMSDSRIRRACPFFLPPVLLEILQFYGIIPTGEWKMAEKGGSGAKKGGKNIIVVIVLVVGLAGGVFAGKTFFGGSKAKVEEKPKVGHALPLGEFIVNLRGGAFLKASIELGLQEGIAAEALKEETAPLKDAVVMVFSDKSREDLDKKEGKEKTKKEILEHVNEILSEKTKVKEPALEVYFTSFTMQ
jgi:flagellar FliL protein